MAPATAHASGLSAAKRRVRTSARSSRRTAPKITIAMPATSEGRSGRRLSTGATDAGVVAGVGALPPAVVLAGLGAPPAVVVGEPVGVLVRDGQLADADVAVDHEARRAGRRGVL